MKNEKIHPPCPKCKSVDSNRWVCTNCNGSGRDGCGDDIFECGKCDGKGYEFGKIDADICPVCGFEFCF